MIFLLSLLTGMLGVLTHILMKIDKLNRAENGNLDYKKFFLLEWPSIAISITVVLAALVAKGLIPALQNAGLWLAGGFYAIGLSAQSIAYFIKNRTETEIVKTDVPTLSSINTFNQITNDTAA